jgi:crossover junction endodeoxyribonuclease RusA
MPSPTQRTLAQPLRLTLPYPPSVNRAWRKFRGRMVLNPKARKYKQTAALAALACGAFRLTGELRVRMDVYRPLRCGDLDNVQKLVCDALNGIAWHDDKQLVEIVARRFDDRANPRVELTVEAA